MEPITIVLAWAVFAMAVAGVIAGACLMSWALAMRRKMQRQIAATIAMLARERNLLEALQKRAEIQFDTSGQQEFNHLLRSFDRSHPEVAARIEEEMKWATT